MARMELQLGQLEEAVSNAVKVAEANEVVRKIWRKDASLWKSDEASQKLIRNALGWLTVANEMIGVSDELTAFAERVRQRGFKQVMVCGMGGSSLCPEVLTTTFGPQAGFPQLLVLDSTDPDVLTDFQQRIELKHCLFIIASKSGSTTEPNVFYKFWYDQMKQVSSQPGDNFIAITDPGSPLVDAATELGFQEIFLNQADIGGRYSALSYFGMVPAALMGLDIRKLLDRAKQATQECSAVMRAQSNPGLQLGSILGECAKAGRDKLTLVTDRSLSTVGLWIEQLVAESTGKEGRGILPVAGEVLGKPQDYADDRLFVSLSLGPVDASVKQQLDALASAGHPVVYRELNDLYDLGGEFFYWEFATACAGLAIGINPFDQPNVQESKDVTKELLHTFTSHGKLPEQDELVSDDGVTLYIEGDTLKLPSSSAVDALRVAFSTLKRRDYFALLNYVEETREFDALIEELRLLVRSKTTCATTDGYGPRFLHSTGQLHKGGPDTGFFLQLTGPDKTDYAVPGEAYTFSILKQAQALGDFRALVRHGRRAIHIDLGADQIAGLERLLDLITQALATVEAAKS
jgi:glucose-6-phosphate isomerase